MKLRYVALVGLGLLSFGCGSSKAKRFVVYSVDGKQTYTSDAYNGKVLMLDYWATWCGPCKMVQPTIHELADLYANRGLTVLGVTDEPPNVVSDFLKHSPLGYPAVIDRGDRVGDEFKVFGLPCVIILDQNGSVVYNASPPDLKQVGAVLERLMPTKS